MAELGELTLVASASPADTVLAPLEHGQIDSAIERLQTKYDFNVFGLLRDYDIDGDVVDAVEARALPAQYRIVEGDSVATDRDVVVPNDLVGQVMETRGVDEVRIHRNLLTFFRSVFETAKQGQRVEMLAAWEVGRFVGLLLNDEMRLRQNRLPFVGFRALEFSKLVYEEVSGHKFTAEEITPEAQRQHYLHVLPERVASSVGMAVLIDSGMAEEKPVIGLVKKMREHALQPVYNAMEFQVGRDNQEVINLQSGQVPSDTSEISDMPLSLPELGAIFPLDSRGLKAYCEYLKDTDKVSFLPSSS